MKLFFLPTLHRIFGYLRLKFICIIYQYQRHTKKSVKLAFASSTY